MLYEDVEELIQNEEGIKNLLDNLKGTFERIEEFSQTLAQVDLDPKVIAEIMMKSNGHWGELNIIYRAIDTYKSNKELIHYHTEKIRIESAVGQKFVSSATEKEASALTVNERRVRNIVEAYMSSADKNISTGQSLLKYLLESKNRNNLQEG